MNITKEPCIASSCVGFNKVKLPTLKMEDENYEVIVSYFGDNCYKKIHTNSIEKRLLNVCIKPKHCYLPDITLMGTNKKNSYMEFPNSMIRYENIELVQKALFTAKKSVEDISSTIEKYFGKVG